jgi:hypothetical protein
MKKNLLYKFLLSIVAVLLLLNFTHGMFSSGAAEADKGNEDTGRYQISAWSSQSGPRSHHSGYYVIDTTTGKVVDSKSEVHSLKE